MFAAYNTRFHRSSAPRTSKSWHKLLLLAAILLCNNAYAHIKWFAPFNVSQAPQPLTDVFNATFLGFLCLFALSVFVFFVLDSYALQKGFLLLFERKLQGWKTCFLPLMRASTGIFFVSLWLYSMLYRNTVWLTPELHADSALVPWLQLLIGLCALRRRSTPLIGYGIIGLYLAAIYSFGVYHMFDYLIFVGIAYFFLVCNASQEWRRSGEFVLYASSAITFLWAAIEKFGYPQWTYPMLDANPELLLGMPPASFMVLAGFIEFTLAFLILGANSVLQRALALSLPLLMIAGIAKFGLVDALGHFMIIAVFTLWFLLGPKATHKQASWLRLVLRKTGSSQPIWRQASMMTAMYVVALAGAFASYYGLHYHYYGA